MSQPDEKFDPVPKEAPGLIFYLAQLQALDEWNERWVRVRSIILRGGLTFPSHPTFLRKP